ncbi:MAG: hypothetical protein JWM64_513 [Frankiales bacterium]|nr:hypothetical protein [Frankiales bacterium]
MDLERHLPVLGDFWEKVLFDTGRYGGRVMAVHREVHARVPLTEEHFARWLLLWRAALEAHFTGPTTERAQAHAQRMARVFLRGLASTRARRELPLVSLVEPAPG